MPVPRVSRVPFDLLRGIDDVRAILLANTLQFARGFAANNALLWGARGMGKSSLVKAVHAHVNGLGEAAIKPADPHRDRPRGYRGPAAPDAAHRPRTRGSSSSATT
jgi:hypothetical protein